ncbi:hypothetical protein MKW98_021727 [Papaver atlanticum]|uniref:Myb-like domain-containing protein n=1 Tax=Papaver atlanticum TaxID=357466 RepID=A0AAD4SEZ9_9MAGN|nr:hypothetical protein MKW98_021727 [Papaver atlanticum]
MSGSDSPKVTWTIKEDQILETALFVHDENSPNRWEKIAKDVGGKKTVEDVKKRYMLLQDAINSIESGESENFKIVYEDDKEGDKKKKGSKK